jgi:hypothetical protein
VACGQSGIHKSALEPDFLLQKGLYGGGSQPAIAQFTLNLLNPPPEVDAPHPANGALKALRGQFFLVVHERLRKQIAV